MTMIGVKKYKNICLKQDGSKFRSNALSMQVSQSVAYFFFFYVFFCFFFLLYLDRIAGDILFTIRWYSMVTMFQTMRK